MGIKTARAAKIPFSDRVATKTGGSPNLCT